MNRREWLKGCTAGLACAGVPRVLWGADDVNLSPRRAGVPLPVPASRAAGMYSVLAIGDTHYDRAPASVYHAAYPGTGVSASLAEIQRAEFKRNGEMWASRIPRLLAAARRARRDDTAFAIQVGDLIQGDCNDGGVHAQMASDAFGAIKAALGGDLPLRLVVGNHDIRNGAQDSAASFYRSWMTARMTEECGKTIASTNFFYRQGPDLWVHVDFTQPSLPTIYEAFRSAPGARYRFLVTHGPAMPSDGSSASWMLFGSSDHTRRRELRKFLLDNDFIVVAGHMHTTELMECQTDCGRFMQVIVNSVWKDESLAQFNPQCTRPDEYGRNQKTNDGRALLGEYKAALVRYVRSAAAGFMRLDVSSSGVVARMFGGDAAEPFAEWALR